MVVDSNDNVHYFNYKGSFSNSTFSHRVKHFTLENGSWTNSTLKNSFCVHTSSDECSLEAVIDSNDVIHITHEISEDDVFGGQALSCNTQTTQMVTLEKLLMYSQQQELLKWLFIPTAMLILSTPKRHQTARGNN